MSDNSVYGLIHVKYIEKLKENKPNRICFLIDGGTDSKKSFDIITKEFLHRLKHREMVGCYIYNSTDNSTYNWQYQKNYILDQYLFSFDRLIKYPNLFYLQDKKYRHNVEQAYYIANNLLSKYFIFNFYSLKEQNLLTKNIFYGLDFLLTSSKIPILIMKDELTRIDKEKNGCNSKGYTWLFIFDGTNTKSFYVLEYFWPLIDRKKDFLYILTTINSGFYSDKIRDIFIKKMNDFNLKENINYFYMSEYIEDKKYFKFMKEFINFNEDYYFDFVLFYNNPLKYKINKNHSYQLIMEIKANIGFVNLDNIDNYKSEEIIDFEEIKRIEKEELRQKLLRGMAIQSDERELVREYQALQIALLNEYEEKKLERQDTNTSLLNNSKMSNSNNINNDNNNDNNNEDNFGFILSNNLIRLPPLKNKNINNRFPEEKKNETPTRDNNNKIFSKNNNTINGLKTKSASKIQIKAKDIETFDANRNINDAFYKTNKSLNKYNGKNNISTQRQNIKPMNLKDKLQIYAKNKNIKLKQ